MIDGNRTPTRFSLENEDPTGPGQIGCPLGKYTHSTHTPQRALGQFLTPSFFSFVFLWFEKYDRDQKSPFRNYCVHLKLCDENVDSASQTQLDAVFFPSGLSAREA